jgi:hypothetical protein
VVIGARRRFRHGRRITTRPHGLGAALQQVNPLLARGVGCDRPLDILCGAVMRFYTFPDFGECVNLIIAERRLQLQVAVERLDPHAAIRRRHMT